MKKFNNRYTSNSVFNSVLGIIIRIAIFFTIPIVAMEQGQGQQATQPQELQEEEIFLQDKIFECAICRDYCDKNKLVKCIREHPLHPVCRMCVDECRKIRPLCSVCQQEMAPLTPEAAEFLYNRGLHFEQGGGYDQLPQDKQRAMYCYLLAAKYGNFKAQYRLAYHYLKSSAPISDKLKNNALAFKWFKLSADQGCMPARYQIGKMFYYGIASTGDKDQDLSEALSWFKRSYTYICSQYFLGLMHEKGKGTMRNKQEATRWYESAAAQGYLPAQERLTNLAQEVSNEDVSSEDSCWWSCCCCFNITRIVPRSSFPTQ